MTFRNRTISRSGILQFFSHVSSNGHGPLTAGASRRYWQFDHESIGLVSTSPRSSSSAQAERQKLTVINFRWRRRRKRNEACTWLLLRPPVLLEYRPITRRYCSSEIIIYGQTDTKILLNHNKTPNNRQICWWIIPAYKSDVIYSNKTTSGRRFSLSWTTVY